MKKFGINKKLLIAYSVILVLMCIGFDVSIVNLMNQISKIRIFYDGPFIVNESANIINSNFERMQKATYRTIVNTDADIVKEARSNALDSAKIIQDELPVVKKHFLGDPQFIEQLEDCLTRLTPMREHVLTLAAGNKPPKNRNLPSVRSYRKSNRLRTSSSTILQRQKKLRQPVRNYPARHSS